MQSFVVRLIVTVIVFNAIRLTRYQTVLKPRKTLTNNIIFKVTIRHLMLFDLLYFECFFLFFCGIVTHFVWIMFHLLNVVLSLGARRGAGCSAHRPSGAIRVTPQAALCKCDSPLYF